MKGRAAFAWLTLAIAATAQAAMRFWSHRWVAVSFKLAVSVGLIVIVARNLERGALSERFVGQSPGWLFAASAVTLSQIVLAGLRWKQILDGLGARVSHGRVMLVSYIGGFFNSWLLGSTGGDVVRALLAPSEVVGRTGIVHSVLFDRLASLLGLGAVVVPLVVFDLGPFARSLPLVASLAVLPLTLFGMAGLAVLSRAVAHRRGAVFTRLRELAESWRVLCRAPTRLAAAIVFAAGGQIAVSLTASCLAWAQHLDVSFLDFVVLMPPVTLIVALPISAGGWGVREGAIVAALAPAGVGTGAALLLSVEMGLIAALVSLPGGAIWLLRYLGRPSRALAAGR